MTKRKGKQFNKNGRPKQIYIYLFPYTYTHTHMYIYKNYMCVCIIYCFLYMHAFIYINVYIKMLWFGFLNKKPGKISYQLNKWHQCPSLHWCLWLRTKSRPLGVNHLLWISSHTFFLHIERERKQKPCHITFSWASGGKGHGTRSNSKQENENRKLLETGIGGELRPGEKSG